MSERNGGVVVNLKTVGTVGSVLVMLSAVIGQAVLTHAQTKENTADIAALDSNQRAEHDTILNVVNDVNDLVEDVQEMRAEQKTQAGMLRQQQTLLLEILKKVSVP